MSKVVCIPRSALVLMVGISSSGKTTLAQRVFPWHVTICSDEYRMRVCDDVGDMTATADAFETMRVLAQKRLSRRLLTVIDAMNVRSEFRAMFLTPAHKHRVPVWALVMSTPLAVCMERHKARRDRPWGVEVLEHQYADYVGGIDQLRSEGVVEVVVVAPDHEIEVQSG